MPYFTFIDGTIAGIFLALFSYFLDYCFWDGSIFGRWLPNLAKVNLFVFRREKYELCIKSNDSDNNAISHAQMMFFYKILGGCVFCSNVWLVIFAYFTCFGFRFELILQMLISITVSHFVLRLIVKE